ncbi:hypothetical protein J4228_03675 [Candidatus Woesearchaeota archaeon]|nr:hypothetical protein [Candidatus Woesearchaeota archaeon]
MDISFFEEFPTLQNLDKLRVVSWPAKLYVAAKSVQEFKEITSKIKRSTVKEYIYWPILENEEGYWISPFSEQNALLRIFSELKGKDIPVMLDLELPTTKNIFLYVTEFFHFQKNKKLIRDFIENYNGEVYLAEYYPEGKTSEKILQFLGLHYLTKNAKIIKMMYHSLHNFHEEKMRTEIQRGIKEFGQNFLLAFGTIAVGIGGNEPLLTATQLKKDLELAEKIGITEVVIFRLGGLNQKYQDVLKEFV